MSNSHKYNTFWGILRNIGIEIPPIQRDYAQGREIDKVNKIRNQFLETIIQALNENNKLSLDFVYGKIHGIKNEIEHTRNKQAIQSLLNTLGEFASTVDLKLENAFITDKSASTAESIYLIPLDGQQRLTTLFLLHWYIAKRLGDSEAINLLSRFRYKTRKTSSSFLKLLSDLESSIEFKSEIVKKQKLSEGSFFEGLKNNENFSVIWLADPTVHAMMVMLQEIHYKLQDVTQTELEYYWKGLTDNSLISFSFLDLKDFNLSDELYVKMNGRGKQLCSFENFKAWLFGVIENDRIIEANEWECYKQKFDVDWNDIFWHYKSKGIYVIDDAYFNYFKKSLLYEAAKNVEIDKNSFKENTRLTSLIEFLIEGKELDWENYKEEIKHTIRHQFHFLSLFDKILTNDYLTSFSKFYFGTPEKNDWQSAIKNYITYSFVFTKDKYLSKYNQDDLAQLSDYHRIMLNLYNNTNIDNQLLYHLAFKEIDQVNHNLKLLNYNISAWIDDFEYDTKSVFTEQQILEEILKCRLMNDFKWKELIIKAEESKYFEGQLNFWFFQTGISLEKGDFEESWLDNKGLKDIFEEISCKIEQMFDVNGINIIGKFSDRIFERALLSSADYLLNEKGYKCFGRNVGRDVSWKRLFFRDRNSEATNKGLKEIFDLDFSDVKISLEQYIKSNLASLNIENWRRFFVENALLVKYLGNLKYIRNIDNHGWVLIKDGYKTYIGEHYELFSLDFYLRYLKDKSIHPFYKIDYYSAPKNSLEDFPCAYLNWNYKNVEYAIDLKFLHDKYQIIFFCRDKDDINDQIERELIEIGLQRDKNYLYVTFDECRDCFFKITEIAEKLREL